MAQALPSEWPEVLLEDPLASFHVVTATHLPRQQGLATQAIAESLRDLPSNLFQEWQGGRVNAHDPVGTYRAKAFGLHDTIGNVWEWCRDRHGSYVIDPMPGDGERAGDEGDTRRTVRGGSFINNAASAQAAVRYPTAPEQALRTSLAAASRPQQKLAAVCARLGICFLGVTPAIVARSPQRTRCD